MSSTTKTMVDNNIKEKKVTVFGKSYCPYCKKVKNALDEHNVGDVNIINIDGNPQMDQIQDYLQSLTGARTVPRVFVCGKFFGGCDETVKGLRDGSFKEQLSRCG